MITYSTIVKKFTDKGEKSGWSYIEITNAQAEKLRPGSRKSFRVKGKVDGFAISKTAIIPMGEGSFILPFNAALRKGTGKVVGDSVTVSIELDEKAPTLSKALLVCLKDEPSALEFFKSLTPGHQQYFSKWIESAKTASTKAKRITMAVIALSQGQGYPEMIRANKRVG